MAGDHRAGWRETEALLGEVADLLGVALERPLRAGEPPRTPRHYLAHGEYDLAWDALAAMIHDHPEAEARRAAWTLLSQAAVVMKAPARHARACVRHAELAAAASVVTPVANEPEPGADAVPTLLTGREAQRQRDLPFALSLLEGSIRKLWPRFCGLRLPRLDRVLFDGKLALAVDGPLDAAGQPPTTASPRPYLVLRYRDTHSQALDRPAGWLIFRIQEGSDEPYRVLDAGLTDRQVVARALAAWIELGFSEYYAGLGVTPVEALADPMRWPRSRS